MASKSIKLQPNVVTDLHKNWTPHPGQIATLKALFQKHKRLVFTQCGRKWGKTELVCYVFWRWCNSFPKQCTYYIAPYATQAKEIIWASNRFQTFGPTPWIKKILAHEMRIIFWNDSFIKVCGADNDEALRGPNPNLAAYEEYKDFPAQFHTNFAPNLMDTGAPLVVIGTPPSNDVVPSDKNFLDLAEEARTAPYGFFYSGPSWERTNNPDFLTRVEEQRKLYASRGEEDVFMREYGGVFVRGGSLAHFPMFNENIHVLPYQTMLEEIRSTPNQWQFYCGADPGTAHCFAVALYALNPYEGKIWMLDEIIETVLSRVSVGVVYPQIMERVSQIAPPRDWFYFYDEAALWFLAEVNSQYPGQDIGWQPTQKYLMRQENQEEKPYLSTLKDWFNNNVFQLSDRCVTAIREIKGYQKDRKTGKTPKGNDHCLGGSTLVITNHGHQRIDSLPRDNLAVHAMYGLVFADNCRQTGVKPLWRFCLDNGNLIECTSEHLLLGIDGLWYPAIWFAFTGKEMAHYESASRERVHPGIRWKILLSLWQLLLPSMERRALQTASGGVEIPPRSSPFADGCSSQGRESGKQCDREPGATLPLGTPASSHDPGEASQTEAVGHKPPSWIYRQVKRVAQVRSWAQLLFENHEGELGQKESCRISYSQGLRRLWQILSNLVTAPFQVLPSELQGYRVTAKTGHKVTKVEYLGPQPTYNMETECHAFSLVAGPLSHNCLDITRYFASFANFSYTKKRPLENRILTIPRNDLSFLPDFADESMSQLDVDLNSFDSLIELD